MSLKCNLTKIYVDLLEFLFIFKELVKITESLYGKSSVQEWLLKLCVSVYKTW